jgi:transcription antitermination factor NusG
MATNTPIAMGGTASQTGLSARGMAGATQGMAEWPGLPAEYCVVRWYAAHTSANHEERVAERFVTRGVEHFLPTYPSVRRWKDRRVTLQLPLFPGYVFVRLALRDRLSVVQIPGVARLVGFGGAPTALPEQEIDALRAGLASGGRAEPHPFLTVGRRVRVKTGSMAGLEGILMRRKSRARLVVSVELIQRAVAVEIDEVDVETLALLRQTRIGRQKL